MPTIPIRTAVLALGMALFVPVGNAQESETPPSPEKSLAAISMRPAAEKPAAAKAWLDAHGSQLAQGQEYLLYVARAWAEPRSPEHGDAVLRFASQDGWKPAPELATAVLEAIYARFEMAVEQKDAPKTQEIVPVALRLATSAADAYLELGSLLRVSEEPVFRRQFSLLMSRVLSDARIPANERYGLVVQIQRSKPRPTRLALFLKMPRAKGEDGKPLPNVDLEGKEITLDQYRGKVLLVDFWATWCGPCMREMPDVVALQREYADKGFAVLGISLDSEKTRARIPEVAERFGMTWRQICDGDGWESRFATANGVDAIPFTFLLDRQGEIRYAGLRGAELRQKVEELLAW